MGRLSNVPDDMKLDFETRFGPTGSTAEDFAEWTFSDDLKRAIREVAHGVYILPHGNATGEAIISVWVRDDEEAAKVRKIAEPLVRKMERDS